MRNVRLDYDFTWVLPGHGHGHRAASAEAMRRELETAITYLSRL